MKNVRSLAIPSSKVLNAPCILRTCKKIYNEAVSILYTRNALLISQPKQNLEWLDQIGPVNANRLRRLRIFVEAVWRSARSPWTDSPGDDAVWYKLLDQLAPKTTGLQYLYVHWHSEPSCGYYGAGRDLRFIRGLAKLQGLQAMVINGSYAKHWPRYLIEKMGVQLQEKDPGSPYMREEALRKYQRGTESLIR